LLQIISLILWHDFASKKQKKVKKSKKKKNKAQKSIGYSLTYKSQVVKYSKMK